MSLGIDRFESGNEINRGICRIIDTDVQYCYLFLFNFTVIRDMIKSSSELIVILEYSVMMMEVNAEHVRNTGSGT